jgi:hypothetical protein
MKSERIFISGPYQPRNCTLHDASRQAQYNVDKAIEVANALIAKGHFIFVPHVSHYIHTHYSSTRDMGEWWYEEDNTFLDHWATALYYISPSQGADAELQRAKQLGLLIYYTLNSVPDATRLWEEHTYVPSWKHEPKRSMRQLR